MFKKCLLLVGFIGIAIAPSAAHAGSPVAVTISASTSTAVAGVPFTMSITTTCYAPWATADLQMRNITNSTNLGSVIAITSSGASATVIAVQVIFPTSGSYSVGARVTNSKTSSNTDATYCNSAAVATPFDVTVAAAPTTTTSTTTVAPTTTLAPTTTAAITTTSTMPTTTTTQVIAAVPAVNKSDVLPQTGSDNDVLFTALALSAIGFVAFASRKRLMN